MDFPAWSRLDHERVEIVKVKTGKKNPKKIPRGIFFGLKFQKQTIA